MNEPPIGKAAILFMAVVLALLVAVSFARGGLPPRPVCLRDDVEAEKCAVLAGSSDRAGILVLTMKRNALDKGAVLGGFSFPAPWESAPSCTLRPDDSDYPKVEVEITSETFKILASQSARYPRTTRWAYVCTDSK